MTADKSIWDYYDELSPLIKVEINFAILVLLLGLIFWADRWFKKRNALDRPAHIPSDGKAARSSLIKQEANGVIKIYIARWRYSVPAIAFAIMLYVLLTGFAEVIKGLPKGQLHHWTKDFTLVVVVGIGILVVIATIVGLLKMGYKAIQMEIGKDDVRFRKSTPRGGIMFSDRYVTLKYSELREIHFREMPLIGYVLQLKTPTETYVINLMLSPSEKVAVYRLLDDATRNWQT